MKPLSFRVPSLIVIVGVSLLGACAKEPSQAIVPNPNGSTTTPVSTGNNTPATTPATTPAKAADPGKEKSGVKQVKVAFVTAEAKPTAVVSVPRVEKTEEEWKKQLTKDQFAVVRSKGTERPFCGALLDNKLTGVYCCVACDLPLFASNAKFESGTGWPSFFQPIARENVAEFVDRSHGMIRTEINCARCDGHLGHVFDDGPRPTGLRYCLNSESLTFTPMTKMKEAAAKYEKELEAAKAASEKK